MLPTQRETSRRGSAQSPGSNLLSGSEQTEGQKALRERERSRERLRRLNKQYRYLEIEEEQYQREKRELESALLRLAIPQEKEVLSAGVYIESLADAWDAATPAERREMGRFMLVAVYADTALEEE